MSKTYCLYWNMPPVGFGKRSADGKTCQNPNCRNVHEDIPDNDKDQYAARELETYLLERPKDQGAQKGKKGKEGKEGKGGAKGDTGKNGKGLPLATVPEGVDPLTIQDAWKSYDNAGGK